MKRISLEHLIRKVVTEQGVFSDIDVRGKHGAGWPGAKPDAKTQPMHILKNMPNKNKPEEEKPEESEWTKDKLSK